MNIDNIKDKISSKVKENYKPDSPKKKILLGVIVVLLGALGFEMSNTDFDLGKLLNGSSLSESKVLRDIDGNVVTDKTKGKTTDAYNCDDFKTQTQAQKFFKNAGGPNVDTNRLDGNNDGIACQGLPKE